MPINIRKYALLRYFKKNSTALIAIYGDNLIPFCLNVNGIKIPINRDNSDIASEFMDIMLQEICKDRFIHDAICDDLYCEGPYEHENVKIECNDVVIDCGANIGMFSALASHKGAIVYSFEPSENIIETYLSKTAQLNPNIYICNYALSDKCGDVWFAISSEHHSMNHIEDPKNDDHKNSVVIQATTLDEFVHQNHLSKVNFIKADIEGAERNMLMGAQKVLHEFAPKLAICTYHKPDDPRVLREIILQANPNYVIVERWKKVYAHVPK